jgi:hypothetical protein
MTVPLSQVPEPGIPSAALGHGPLCHAFRNPVGARRRVAVSDLDRVGDHRAPIDNAAKQNTTSLVRECTAGGLSKLGLRVLAHVDRDREVLRAKAPQPVERRLAGSDDFDNLVRVIMPGR